MTLISPCQDHTHKFTFRHIDAIRIVTTFHGYHAFICSMLVTRQDFILEISIITSIKDQFGTTEDWGIVLFIQRGKIFTKESGRGYDWIQEREKVCVYVSTDKAGSESESWYQT